MKNDDLLCNIFTKLNRFNSCCLKPYAEQSLEYFSDSEFLTPWLDESFVFQVRNKKNGEIWQGRLQWKGKKFIIFLINTALGTYLLFGWFYSNQCYYCPVTFFPVDPKIWQNFECQHYFLFTKTNIRSAHVVTCALVLGCRCTYKWYDFPLPNPTSPTVLCSANVTRGCEFFCARVVIHEDGNRAFVRLVMWVCM